MKLKDNEYEWIGGYVIVYDKKTKKCCYKHRLIMEQYLGRKLKRSEIVHHKDNDKTNNRISNLEITTISEHNKKHRNWKGKNNPNYNGMSKEHIKNLKMAWAIRKIKFGESGSKDNERLKDLGKKNSLKRWGD